MSNVDRRLRGNDHRILLIKAAALGLISLISLSQLGTGARFGSGGPRILLPMSVTAVIVAAVMFGLAYRETAFASAQMEARLTAGTLKKEDAVPTDIDAKSGRGWNLALLGLLFASIAVIFYLLSVWWPAAASLPARAG